MNENKIVDSRCVNLQDILNTPLTLDFYQREYVWEKKQLDDLIYDISTAFLKSWKPGHEPKHVENYDPYFMGEIVVSTGNGKNSIIDGQQRLTSLTLLLIYMLHTYKNCEKFPTGLVEKAIYDDHYGTKTFKLNVEERKKYMENLYKGNFEYESQDKEERNHNLIDRYNDIKDCWNDKIDKNLATCFAYFILNKIMFSKVWTTDDDFAYTIFETMNDRGLSLTNVEMLRSYLLAKIDTDTRRGTTTTPGYETKFDNMITQLCNIKLSSKSKPESEFFKIILRTHYAEDLSKEKNKSDFVVIGNAFHRWVRNNEKKLNLKNSEGTIDFINRMIYFSKQYALIHKYISDRDAKNHFYLIVNSDYDFTLQPALIMAAIKYQDSDDIIEQKIQIISKFITRILSWKIWNQKRTAQSTLESPIYDLCKKIRNIYDINQLKQILNTELRQGIFADSLDTPPILNQSNKKKIKVLLALITEIVALESNESGYLLNEPKMQIEHIWADHPERHIADCPVKEDFYNTRNTIGDLLILPESFNKSYNDSSYDVKVKHYLEQNILAQTLNSEKYSNNPSFIKFKEKSSLAFQSYDVFDKQAILDRSELYKQILIWNWSKE